MPQLAVKPQCFTVESARLAGLKSAALRSQRKAQRELATVKARSEVASNALSNVQLLATTIQRERNAKSEAVLNLLSVEAVKQAETLAKAEKNEPAIFKTVVEACDKLFGWSRADTPSCLIQNNYLAELIPQEPHVVSAKACENANDSSQLNTEPNQPNSKSV